MIPAPFIPPWLSIAIKELGVQEIKGEKHNPKILQYHDETSLNASDDETPWCSSFTNWCFAGSGIEGTNKANARSWLEWGSEIKEPIYGCVAVLKRGAPPQGHVGFLVSVGKDKIILLGGNQGDRVSIASFNKSDVLGYRLP